MTAITMAGALNEALRRSLRADERVVVLGEDVGRLGGVFRVTDGLQAQFGDDRVIDMPLAESGIIGVAIGMAIHGDCPVAEIQFDGFSFPAFEQIISHCAKYRSRTRGEIGLSMVLRIPYGGGIGAPEHHGESPEAHFAHVPGLKVVTPSNPGDAFSLLRASLADPDPVVFLEPKRRYWTQEEIDLDTLDGLPIGRARIECEGTDVTVLSYGPMVEEVRKASEAAASQGISCELIDLRSLVPLDWGTVLSSVEKTGRAVVAHEAPMTGGFGAEIAARITEQRFDSLAAPILRVAAYDVPYAPACLEGQYLPDAARVLEAVQSVMAY